MHQHIHKKYNCKNMNTIDRVSVCVLIKIEMVPECMLYIVYKITHLPFITLIALITEYGGDIHKINQNLDLYEPPEEDPSVCGVKRKWSTESTQSLPGKKRKNEKYQYHFAYSVSVWCHICNDHFDDIKKYKSHLKQHYDTDESRTWLHCDLGCEVNPNHPGRTAKYTGVSGNSTAFIYHIAAHTKTGPFKCIRCDQRLSQLSSFRKHWESKHFNAFAFYQRNKNRK
eukprot:249835_1